MDIKNIEQVILFKAIPEKVYEFLTSQEKHEMFTDAETFLPLDVGGEFRFFGGAITGVIKELIPNKKIVWDWIASAPAWPEDHKSLVTITLDEVEDGTELKLIHIDVPEESLKMIEEGWHERYWQPMKRFLER